MRLSRIFAVWLSCCIAICFVAKLRASGSAPGVFSADAVELWNPSAPQRWTITSPDRLNAIMIYELTKGDLLSQNAFLRIGGKRLDLFPGHVDPEVLWSPDSRAFAETYSSGGAVGLFHLVVYYLERDRLQATEPTTEVTREFLSHPRVCFEPENPNIGAIKWVKGSSEILVAAETLPHSNCDNMGTFRAYLIHLPEGQILKTYGQIEAKKLFWKHLGAELRNADDDCILKPGSCEVPQLHPEKKGH